MEVVFPVQNQSSTCEKLISKHLIQKNITGEPGKYVISDWLQRRVDFHWQRCPQYYIDMSRTVKKVSEVPK